MPTGLLVQQIGLLVYNVVTYGATGNGVTNDYAAIQAAITACANAGGGIVFFPVGTYLIMSTLIVNNDNVHLVGTGHGSIIVAGSGVASAQMLWVQGPATTFRYGFAIYDLSFWCTGVTGVTGIQLDQTYYATLHNVDIEGIYSVNLYLNGTASYYGAYTHVSHCHLGATPGGAGSAGIGIQTNDHEFITVENSVFNWFNQSGGLAIEFQKTNNVITGCSFDECDTAVLLYFTYCNYITNCQFDRGVTRFIELEGAVSNVVANNFFGAFVGSGSKDILDVNNGSNQNNIIEGNTVKTSSGWTAFVVEAAGTGTPGNLYANNITQGLTVTRISGIFRGNQGYNPVGYFSSQPTVPATTVAYTNTLGADAWVSIATLGSLSAVAIGGHAVTAAPALGSTYRVVAGGTITLTYSGTAPTWQWYGD